MVCTHWGYAIWCSSSSPSFLVKGHWCFCNEPLRREHVAPRQNCCRAGLEFRWEFVPCLKPLITQLMYGTGVCEITVSAYLSACGRVCLHCLVEIPVLAPSKLAHSTDSCVTAVPSVLFSAISRQNEPTANYYLVWALKRAIGKCFKFDVSVNSQKANFCVNLPQIQLELYCSAQFP